MKLYEEGDLYNITYRGSDFHIIANGLDDALENFIKFQIEKCDIKNEKTIKGLIKKIERLSSVIYVTDNCKLSEK